MADYESTMVTTKEIHALQNEVERFMLPHFSSVEVNHPDAQIEINPSLSFPDDDPIEVEEESYPVNNNEDFIEAAKAVLESAGVHNIRVKGNSVVARIQ